MTDEILQATGDRRPGPVETIALYGSLRADTGMQRKLGVRSLLLPLGPCRLRGILYDLGPYPGLAEGSGLVTAELYRLRSPKALRILDEFEEFLSDDPEGSMYLRVAAALARPGGTAWVYRYNRPVAGRPRVPSGDWLAHLKRRRA